MKPRMDLLLRFAVLCCLALLFSGCMYWEEAPPSNTQPRMTPRALPSVPAPAKTVDPNVMRPEEPKQWFFENEVDINYLDKVISHIPRPDIVIIDARPESDYVMGHLPTAINVPGPRFEEKRMQLPSNKAVQLIFYDDGFTAKDADVTARKVQEMGYGNIAVFAGGFAAWKRERMVAVEFPMVEHVLAQAKPALIVDLRERENYLMGHIPNSVSMPSPNFDELNGLLPRDLDMPILFYCAREYCQETHIAARKAMEIGYSVIRYLEADYAWPPPSR